MDLGEEARGEGSRVNSEGEILRYNMFGGRREETKNSDGSVNEIHTLCHFCLLSFLVCGLE